MLTLQNILDAYFGPGVSVAPVETDVQVGSGGNKIVEFNPQRVGLTLTNNGSAPLWFTFGEVAAVVGKGTLFLGYAVMRFTWLEDFTICGYQLMGITSFNTNNVHVVEYVLT